jgi:hypothetical protein
MRTAPGARAVLVVALSASVFWIGASGSVAAAAGASCTPPTDELIAAIGAVVPPSSPLWSQVEAALQGGSDGGQSIQAVLGVLRRNNLTWDCASHQLVGANGAKLPRVSPGGPVTTAPPTGATSEPATSVLSSGSGAPIDNQASGAPATGGGTGNDTPWIVVALMVSTGLVVFVVTRYLRRPRATSSRTSG